MNAEHAKPELFAALAIAQGEVENASKNSNNPHFKSKYADLAEVLNTIRPTFAKHGLSILQSTGFDGERVHVTTLIAHTSGGYVSSEASCVPAKCDAQGIGSATTYLRRYGLAAMAGVAQEDDDGNSAAHNRKPEIITDADGAKLATWLNAIHDTSTQDELAMLGGEIAEAKLPAAIAVKVRAAYAARKHSLTKRAA